MSRIHRIEASASRIAQLRNLAPSGLEVIVPEGKTENAARRVPVHPVLMKRGFLDYAKAAWKLPGGRLFPRAATVSKAFTRYRRGRGVNRPKLVEHSFRHCFAGQLDAIGLDSDRKAYIMGHARSFTSERYGHGGELRGLARVVAKVRYKGLRLPG